MDKKISCFTCWLSRLPLAMLVFAGVALFAPRAHANEQVTCEYTDQTLRHVLCRVDEPNVRERLTPYLDIPFETGDSVTINAGGCAQTGGIGATWKRYVNPQGPNSGQLYHGLILIPGVTPGMPGVGNDGLVRISSLLGQTVQIPAGIPPGQLFLRLGYEDDDYSDNGYWGHDDGTGNQCRNVGNAFVVLDIEHRAPPPEGRGTVAVYTYHNDNPRLGWNKHETLLRPATVNTSLFGRLWSRPVDGQVYAQPLYAPNVGLQAGHRNLLFVVTEHNSVYALDADYGIQLWAVNLGPSVPTSEVASGDIEGPEYGITGTPVINGQSQTLYVVAKTFQRVGAANQQIYRLHALDLATGASRPGWPMVIQGCVVGNGGDSVAGSITFDPKIQHQRPGLLLLPGRVYVAFGSHGDNSLGRYHGWIFSYDTANPAAPPLIYNTTPDPLSPPQPNSDGDPVAAAGIWQTGFGLAADDRGEIFFETANGHFNADLGNRNVGDSFVRLSSNLSFANNPQNYFTPSNQAHLLREDLDLGSGGAMVIPDQPRTHTPHLLVGAGKTGVLYLLNRDNLGGFTGRTDPLTPNHALQNIPDTGDQSDHGMFCSPAYWESIEAHYVFYTRIDDHLHRLKLGLNPNTGSTNWLFPSGDTANIFGGSCPTPVVSSNGVIEHTGIVWVLRKDGNTLRAYNAEDLTLLWHSRMKRRDYLDGGVVKFSLPTVADGRVYLGTRTNDGAQGSVMCYGLLPEILLEKRTEQKP
jgi:hypothetical protein